MTPWLLCFAVCWPVVAGRTSAAESHRQGSPAASDSAGKEGPPRGVARDARVEEAQRPWSIPAKLFRHAERVLSKHDADGSGQLERREWAAMRTDPGAADSDGDGVITVDELAEYLAQYARGRSLEPMVRPWEAAPDFLPLLRPSTPAEAPESRGEHAGTEKPEAGADKPPSPSGTPSDRHPRGGQKFFVPPSHLPPGLPEWFLSRDLDGDGQLDFAEFAPQPSRAAAEQFRRYDLNQDGLLTPEEVLRAGKPAGSPKEGRPARAK